MRQIALALALILTLAGSSLAAPVLKFDDPLSPGGNVSYSGTLGDPIVGTDIQFQTITGIGTPLNNGVTLSCVGCLLDFQTGGVTSEGPTTWNATGGGSLTITGAIPGLGLGAGTTLAIGSFANVPNPTVNGAETSAEFSGFGFDQKNETLADFYGLGPDFIFLSTEIALTTARIGGDGSFSATPNNSDFNNAALVPAPAGHVLMWLGLAALAVPAWLRRRSSRTDG